MEKKEQEEQELAAENAAGGETACEAAAKEDAAGEKATGEAAAKEQSAGEKDDTVPEQPAGTESEKKPEGEPSAPEDEASAPEGEVADAEAQPPQVPDWKEMYARTMADFDNFRKRTARDREELFKSAATDILKDLLPTVDNLALALDKAADKEDPFVKGVQLVYDGLVKMLADHGAVPVDSLGEPLDTNFHEAIATLPSPEVPEGHVMTEVKRGWLLNGKVLRAAQVVVSAGKGE